MAGTRGPLDGLHRRHALLGRQRQAAGTWRGGAGARPLLGGSDRALPADVRRAHAGVAARYDPFVLPRFVRVQRRRIQRAVSVLPRAAWLRPRGRAARARGPRRYGARRARAVRLPADARRDAARALRHEAHELVARARSADARAGAWLARKP